MTYTSFAVEIEAGIAHVRLNRPETFNAMTPAFFDELPAIARDIDDNAGARVMIVSSTGKHFCAGMSLDVFQSGGGATNPSGMVGEIGRNRLTSREDVLRMQETFNVLERVRLPVIAAVQGACVGGGVDLTSACDIRYATADAFFCIQEINIGITADLGTFPRLCRLIPEGWVRELAYTGRRLSAAKAKEIGLVNDVFPDQATMLDAVRKTAAEIAERSPLAVYGSKLMINYARDHTIADSLDYVATWQTGMHHGTDTKEHFKAKEEGRAPSFAELNPRVR